MCGKIGNNVSMTIKMALNYCEKVVWQHNVRSVYRILTAIKLKNAAFIRFIKENNKSDRTRQYLPSLENHNKKAREKFKNKFCVTLICRNRLRW